jgi:hypothetical protein
MVESMIASAMHASNVRVALAPVSACHAAHASRP